MNMKERIEIMAIKQQFLKEHLEVVFTTKIKQNQYDLVYKIQGGVNKVPLLSDAAVITFLPYAIMHNLDIYSNIPISTKLYYNIKKQIIPQLSIFSKTKGDKISVVMPTSNEKFEGDWVGTGISMGVDSFTTIHEYCDSNLPKEYQLTCLVHLKTGAHHGMLGYFDKESEQKLFNAEHERVKQYCDTYSYNLITVETNLFEITNAEFGYNFDTTHTFRNLACILLMQNHFSKYYYASTYNLDSFFISLNEDIAHYEKWLIPYISNDSISFYSANEDMNRVEKTKFISKFEDTYDTLHVCWKNDKNCGTCDKCIRTLVTLDIIGALNNYKNSFDLDEYYKNKEQYIFRIVSKQKKDLHFNEIYKYMIDNNIKVPSKFKVFFARVFFALKKHGIKRLFVAARDILRH